MNKRDKILINLTSFSAIFFLINNVCKLFFKSFTLAEFLAQLGILMFQIFAIILLMSNGTFYKKTYFKLIIPFLFISLLGLFFKIMHWPLPSILLLIGTLGTIALYTYHFIKKVKKTRLDIIKLSWVILVLIVFYLSIITMIPKELSLIPVMILLMAFLDFIATQKKENSSN